MKSRDSSKTQPARSGGPSTISKSHEKLVPHNTWIADEEPSTVRPSNLRTKPPKTRSEILEQSSNIDPPKSKHLQLKFESQAEEIPHPYASQNMKKSLIILVVLVALAILFSAGVFLVIFSKSSPDFPAGVRTTFNAIISANHMVHYMNLSVDPCHDFYQYSCGGWLDSTSLEPDQTDISPLAQLIITRNLRVNDLLIVPDKPGDPPYRRQASHFFHMCLDRARLKERGVRPLLDLIVNVSKMPLLDNSWRDSDFNLQTVLTRLTKLGATPFFSVEVKEDLMEYTVNRIHLHLPDPYLESSSKYMQWVSEVLHKLRMESSNAERDTSESSSTGSSETFSKVELADMKIFQNRLIVLIREAKEGAARNFSARYNPMTIADMEKQFPWLNWMEFFTDITVYPVERELHFSQKELVVLESVQYFRKLATLLSSTSKRTLANFALVQLLKFVPLLGPSWPSVMDDKWKQAGIKDQQWWWKCVERTLEVLPETVSRIYVDKYYNDSVTRYMMEMFGDLKAAFRERLDKTFWLSGDTKLRALHKLDLMTAKIGYPKNILDDKRLDMLARVVDCDDNYFECNLLFEQFYFYDKMKTLREPRNGTRWQVSPTRVSAVYYDLSNTILLPAFMVQPPVFEQSFCSSIIYGSIGMLIGHEITHGFDYSGRQYNERGEFYDWWTQEEKQVFEDKSKCFVKQYDNFTFPYGNVSGTRTLAENLADNVGLRQSFLAYQNYIRRMGKEESPLPWTGLTHKQAFFVAFAQVLCRKIREVLLPLELVGSNPPNPIRVLGTVQNSKEFAETFNCPVNSRMNPVNKCVLW